MRVVYCIEIGSYRDLKVNGTAGETSELYRTVDIRRKFSKHA